MGDGIPGLELRRLSHSRQAFARASRAAPPGPVCLLRVACLGLCVLHFRILSLGCVQCPVVLFSRQFQLRPVVPGGSLAFGWRSLVAGRWRFARSAVPLLPAAFFPSGAVRLGLRGAVGCGSCVCRFRFRLLALPGWFPARLLSAARRRAWSFGLAQAARSSRFGSLPASWLAQRCGLAQAASPLGVWFGFVRLFGVWSQAGLPGLPVPAGGVSAGLQLSAFGWRPCAAAGGFAGAAGGGHRSAPAVAASSLLAAP